MKRSVAIVVQRYGEDIVGGAEAHARQLAEYFVANTSWDIEVLTTCAKSYRTWRNEIASGSSSINGVAVRRFSTWFPRWPGFDVLGRVLRKVRRVALKLGWRVVAKLAERCWVVAQGPYAPGMIDHLRKNAGRYDVVVFFTYLYYPTIAGMQLPLKKKLIVPTAHDEPPFYFLSTADVLNSADAIIANSDSERDLIARVMPKVSGATRIAGLGIDTERLAPEDGSDRNYLLYLGRLSRGKGVDVMLRWYQSSGVELPLVLAGVPDDGFSWEGVPNVRYAGVLSEDEKIDYIRRARCLINPSPLESLSLIVLEAASCGVPLLLNAECEIFRYYSERMSSVFTYDDQESFRTQLRHILVTDWAHSDRRRELLDAREWVQDNYAWSAVMRPYFELIEQV